MRIVKFFQLSRTTQERFVAATRSIGVPRPIALNLAFPHGVWALVFVTLACATLVALAVRVGFGELHSPWALSPTSHIALHVGLVVTALVSMLMAAVVFVRYRACPYRPGIYVFPSGIIDARGPTLRAYSSAQRAAVEVGGGGKVLTVTCEGRSFRFKGKDAEQVARVRAKCEKLFAEYAASWSQGNAGSATGGGSDGEADAESIRPSQRSSFAPESRADAQYDPLIESDYANPFAPTEPLGQLRLRWLAPSLAGAIALGVALGWLVWKGRNLASERKIFAEARRINSEDSYTSYLARGGERSEVTRVLLPRARLEIARTRASVGAIEQFIAEHPDSAIQNEAEQALHQALMDELSKVERAGEFSALLAFARRYQKHASILPKVEAAKANMFSRVRADVEEKIAHPPLREFCVRLLAYVQKHHAADRGGVVELVFVRRPTGNAERLDSALQRSAYFTGKEALPAQYFDAAADSKRQELIEGQLIDAFQKVFPKDMIEFRAGKHLLEVDDQEVPAANIELPTLFVQHHTTLSGSYTTRNPRAVWVGLGIRFRVVFALPGGKRPYQFKFSQWLPPDRSEISREQTGVEGVYDAAAGGAYRKFAETFLSVAFTPP